MNNEVIEIPAGTPHDEVARIVNAATDKGRKDAKDIQIHAIPWEALAELGRVYHFGATERGYGDYNFRGGYDWTLTFDALMRHAFAFWNREENDPESGFNHMAHAAWHALTLCFFALTERGTDDRPT